MKISISCCFFIVLFEKCPGIEPLDDVNTGDDVIKYRGLDRMLPHCIKGMRDKHQTTLFPYSIYRLVRRLHRGDLLLEEESYDLSVSGRYFFCMDWTEF